MPSSFQNGWTNLHTHYQNLKVPFAPSTSFPTCCISVLFNIKQLNVFVLVSHHVFNLQYLDYFYVLCVYTFYIWTVCPLKASWITEIVQKGKHNPGTISSPFLWAQIQQKNPPLISEGLFFKDPRGKNTGAKSNMWFWVSLSLVSYSWWPFIL